MLKDGKDGFLNCFLRNDYIHKMGGVIMMSCNKPEKPIYREPKPGFLTTIIAKAVKPYVVAAALSMRRFEPITEPPRRKTKILFKPGEREALEAEAREDEANGRYVEAGVKYAQVENAAKAYEMGKACATQARLAGSNKTLDQDVYEAIEEYC